MLDLETLATEPYALITQVGACYFTTSGEILAVYESNVDISDSISKGFKIDGKTLKWWLERADNITWLKEVKPISSVLEDLRQFCNYNRRVKIWSHYFDVMILQGACSILQRKFIFSYKRWRDIRTLTGIAAELNISMSKPKKGDPKTHRALDDCIYQVGYVSKILNALCQVRG